MMNLGQDGTFVETQHSCLPKHDEIMNDINPLFFNVKLMKFIDSLSV